MIPDAAVEAVARILYSRNDEWGKPSWEDAPNDLVWKSAHEDFRQDARELLETAAPILMAAGWDEGYATCLRDEEDSHWGPAVTSLNPYRKPRNAD